MLLNIFVIFIFLGHLDRVNDLKFHPSSGTYQSPSTVNIATSSADCTIKLWSLER